MSNIKQAGNSVAWQRWLLIGIVLLLVFSVRGWVVSSFGSQMPYWDQWGGESGLLVKAAAGELGFNDLFAPHNEHRLVISRLVWLAVFFLNDGQWNNLANLYVLAGLAGITAALLAGLYLHLSGWRDALVVLIGVAAVYGLPLAWLNTVWGFQVQFHAQVLLAVLCFYGLGCSRELSVSWWLGVLAGVACLMVAGSGFFIAPSLLLIHLLDSWCRPASDRRYITLTASVAVGLLLSGILLMVGGPESNRYAADSAVSFILALMKNMAWPWHQLPWLGIIMQLPLIVLLLKVVCRREQKLSPATKFVLLLGSYLFGQFLAISLSRGVNGMAPHDRYFDLHAACLVVNLLAIFQLQLRRPILTGHWRRIQSGLIVLWLTLAGAGSLQLSLKHFNHSLPDWRGHSVTQTSNLSAFLGSGDEVFLRDQPRLAIPVDDSQLLMNILNDRRVRRILPPILQQPLALHPGTGSGVFSQQLLPEGIAVPDYAEGFLSSYHHEGGQGEYRSRMLETDFPFLLGRLAGFQPTGKLQLATLQAEEASAKRVRFSELDLSSSQRDWREFSMPVPRGSSYQLVAGDQRDAGWFAIAGLKPAGSLTVAIAMWAWVFRPLAIFSIAFFLALLATVSPRLNDD